MNNKSLESLSDEQKKRFKKLFDIKPNSIDLNGKILNNVLSKDLITCDEEFQLSYKEFQRYFYVNDIISVNKALKNLKDNIESGLKYHYLHSFGKNGKTTFNRRFANENEGIFNTIFIDFGDFHSNSTEYPHSLTMIVIQYFNSLVSEYNDELLDIMLECFNHIANTKKPINTASPANLSRNKYNNLFQSISDDFKLFIQKIREENAKNEKDIIAILFNNQFKQFVLSKYEKNSKKPEDLFYLLILVFLKLKSKEEIQRIERIKREKKEEVQKRNVIFIFDNIDDVITFAPEFITAKIIPSVYSFMEEILSIYLNTDDEVFIDDDILSNTIFIFTYRTANFVSSLFAVENGPKDRKEKLLSAPTYAITSVNSTTAIIEKKINFYEDICEVFNVEKSPNFEVLKLIIDSYKNSSEESEKHIAKLWNGNSFAFTKCFNYLASIHPKSILNDSSLSKNIYKSIFMHYIVKCYTDEASTIHIHHSATLLSAFQYIFNKGMNEKICNLLRMFLSYIVNYNDKHNLQNKNIKTNKDIFEKGVSLYKILKALSDIKDSKGELIYTKAMYQELFEKIFYGEIDTFDYFIICAKKTDITDENGISLRKKHYFNDELDIFFDEEKSKEEKEDKLKDIKIYYNANAKFFLTTAKKQFEFFSAGIESKQPLSINLKIFSANPEKIDNFEVKYNFNNESIISSVFAKVEEVVKATVDFYITSNLVSIYPPQKYCQESYFAIDETFLYDAIIANHITYIEQIRQIVINQSIEFEFQNMMTSTYLSSTTNKITDPKMLEDVNARFVYWIEQYIKLFYWAYNTIKDLAKEVDEHAEATRKSFSYRETAIKVIKESKYKDFKTKIEQPRRVKAE